MDKVVGTTYYDILRATLTRSDPEEFLFFNRNAIPTLIANGDHDRGHGGIFQYHEKFAPIAAAFLSL